jgi:hypothetical protein
VILVILFNNAVDFVEMLLVLMLILVNLYFQFPFVVLLFNFLDFIQKDVTAAGGTYGLLALAARLLGCAHLLLRYATGSAGYCRTAPSQHLSGDSHTPLVRG